MILSQAFWSIEVVIAVTVMVSTVIDNNILIRFNYTHWDGGGGVRGPV